MPEETGPIPVPFVIPNCVEIVTHAQSGGNERANVCHYSYTGVSPSASELEALCNEWESSVIDAQDDVTHVSSTFYKITARDLGDPVGAFAEKSIFRVGADASSGNSSQVSLCLSKRSGRRGRSNHGRFYLFDTADQLFDKDVLNVVFLPLLNNLAENLLEPRQSGRFLPAIASRKHLTTIQIRSFTWDFTVDTQRRRVPGRGA